MVEALGDIIINSTIPNKIKLAITNDENFAVQLTMFSAVSGSCTTSILYRAFKILATIDSEQTIKANIKHILPINPATPHVPNLSDVLLSLIHI